MSIVSCVLTGGLPEIGLAVPQFAASLTYTVFLDQYHNCISGQMPESPPTDAKDKDKRQEINEIVGGNFLWRFSACLFVMHICSLSVCAKQLFVKSLEAIQDWKCCQYMLGC